MMASDSEKTRLTIFLDSESISAWQLSLLNRLRNQPSLSIQAIVQLSQAGRSRPDTLVRFVYGKLVHYDRPKIVPHSDASSLTSVATLNFGCQIISIEAEGAEGIGSRAARIVEILQDIDQDMVLNLGDASVLETLGDYDGPPIWYFRHSFGQTDVHTLGFWEVTSRSDSLYSALHVRGRAGRDYIAYESHSPVHACSFTRTRNEHLWKLPHFVLRSLERHRKQAESPCRARACEAAPIPLAHSLRNPGSSSILVVWRAFHYLLYRFYKALINRIFDERWVLQYCPTGQLEDIRLSSVIRPPPDRFWADPCLVRKEHEYYLFFEDASVETGRGRISVMTIDVDGSHSAPRPVLERPYHLSYPFVFEYDGETYMIPETAENHSIELYRCKQFPDEWGFVHNLMDDIAAYDATVVYYDDRWWMFVNVQNDTGMSSWDEMCIFYSDNPVARSWRSHSNNPVVTDVRRARPAGRIFSQDGLLMRPSQNSSVRYGYGLNFNRIVELSQDRFTEEQVLSITPDRYGPTKGIHTVSRVDTLIVTDAILRAPRLRSPWSLRN